MFQVVTEGEVASGVILTGVGGFACVLDSISQPRTFFQITNQISLAQKHYEYTN